MITYQPHLPCFDAGLGASETRTKPYRQYGEGALELTTTSYVKSISGIASSADKHANAARKMR